MKAGALSLTSDASTVMLCSVFILGGSHVSDSDCDVIFGSCFSVQGCVCDSSIKVFNRGFKIEREILLDGASRPSVVPSQCLKR